MQAAVLTGFGGTDVLEYRTIETPAVASGEALIKVHACGINHYDIFFRRGDVNRQVNLPHILGADVVGEIVELASDVDHLNVGQRVMVAPGYPTDPRDHDHMPITFAKSYAVTGGQRWGGYAEFVCAPARFVLPQPADLSASELATVPLVLTTAVHATKTLAQVTTSHKVLVQAGASGSGAMCIQVAKALGATVMTTVGSEDKFEFVRKLGADVVVDYNTDSFLEQAKRWTDGQGVDAVIDNVGGSTFDGNIRALKRGGHYVNFGMVGGHKADYVFPLIFYKQLHLHGSMMGSMEELEWGLEHLRRGTIKPILDRTMPLQDVAAAHTYIEERQVRGKVILIP